VTPGGNGGVPAQAGEANQPVAGAGAPGGAAGTPGIAAACEGLINFEDSAFEASARLALDQPTGDITGEQAAQLTELTLRDADGISIGDIVCFNGLTAVHFVEGITPFQMSALASLPLLTVVEVPRNYLTDLDWASALTGLVALDVRDNNVQSASALAPLVNLESLNISGTNIVDISPLANLKKLVQLDVSGDPTTDFSPLASMSSLTHLSVANWQRDLAAIVAAAPNLTVLNLHQTQVTDLGPLVAYTGLNELDISDNTCSDFTVLEQPSCRSST
jgi:internalin A